MRIKTARGIQKYNTFVQLSAKRGVLARLRLNWFVVFVPLRDLFK